MREGAISPITPEAEMFADFADFAFYELKLKGAHLVAGFAGSSISHPRCVD